jgi:5-methyltetrahydropteroyltriglutamate--homocysteine methyltransferase
VSIPTEPIGSMPRPPRLLAALAGYAAGRVERATLETEYDDAVRDTIARFESVGSPVVTDGEQRKPSFATYPVDGLPNVVPEDGFTVTFSDGHVRRWPRLTAAPFRYGTYAAQYLVGALRHATVPVKQAVIAPSAVAAIYLSGDIDGYPRDAFLDDVANGAEADIRAALDGGAHSVQLDFSEGRLAVKLDPSGAMLDRFMLLNTRVLSRFTAAEQARIGVHSCPGGDRDSTHSLDADYPTLLERLFSLPAGAFYLQMASQPDPRPALAAVARYAEPHQRVFIGVIDPLDPVVETPVQVRDRVLRAAEYLSPDRLGTCDDCGFAPFGDDVSTSRDTAFAKVAARVEGTALAAAELGV